MRRTENSFYLSLATQLLLLTSDHILILKKKKREKTQFSFYKSEELDFPKFFSQIF